MNKKHAETPRQRNLLLVYESNSTYDSTNEKVTNQKDGKDIRISDLSEEKIKRTRRKMIDELREFGY